VTKRQDAGNGSHRDDDDDDDDVEHGTVRVDYGR
jgi:hypothetical protein